LIRRQLHFENPVRLGIGVDPPSNPKHGLEREGDSAPISP